VWVKNDTANPTRSFKDRVVTSRWPILPAVAGG